MSPGILERFKGRGGSRLRVEQSLGAFPKANGYISPLYVLFGIFNAGERTILIEEAYLRAGRENALDLTSNLGGDGDSGGGDEGGLPREIPPGGTATLWMRARELSARLRDSGYTGTPKLRLLLVDSELGEHGTTFKLRVDEYLQLKDE